MALVLRPPGENASLTDRLRSLAQTRRVTRVAAGALALLAAGLAAAALACTLDAAVHLPAWARAVVLAGCAGVAGVMFVRRVRRPLQEPARPLAVAQLLEHRYPELNDVLASAVSFLEEEDAARLGAPRFRYVAVKRAETMADRADLGVVVPTRDLWRAFGLAAAAALVALPLVVSDPARAATALRRLLDPFGGHTWPTRTTIEIVTPQSGPILLAKGDPFPLAFVVRGELPAEAVVSVRLSGGQPAEERVPIVPSEADSPTAAVSLQLGPDRVQRDFEFRVIANDADTGWRPVAVAPPPRLVPLDDRPTPRLSLTFPAYTQMPPAELPDGIGVIEAVAGTRVTLAAAADRRIMTAALHYKGDLAAPEAAAAVAPLAARPGVVIGAAGAQWIVDSFPADIPVRVSGPDGTRLDAEFVPPLAGLYALRFTDEAGLTGVRLFDIRPFPDPAPVVTLHRPAAGKDPLLLLPSAAAAVRARADDHTFAANRLFLEYRVGDTPFRELPLASAADALAAAPALAGGMILPAAPRPALLQAEQSLPLAGFRRPDGRPPADGDVITLRAAATDWDDYSLLKPPGRSPEVEILVLSPDSMAALLQRDLAALRPELARLRDEQKQAADKLKEVQKAAAAGNLSADDRDRLGQVEQAQREVRGLLADPRDGLRAKAERLRDTARANDLPRSSVTERAETVARALADADERHLQEIDPQLSAARQAADRDPKAAREPLAKAAKHQQGVLDGVGAALEELEQWAGAAEVRGDARAVRERVAKAKDAGERQAERTPPGTPVDLLPSQDRAALGRVADEFDKAAEQAGRLVTKADRVAAEKREQAARDKAAAAAKADTSPAAAAAHAEAAARAEAEAKALEQAARRAGGQELPDQLRKAADAERANRPGEASAAAAEAMKRLDRMVAELAEKPEPQDELAKKRKAEAEQIDKIADAQDELAKKADAANKQPDPAGRAEELQKLAGEQEQLRRETEQLSRKLDREGADESAEQLRRAARQMEQARDELAEGRDPGQKPQDALDRLEEAKDKLQNEQKQEQEQLLREKREQLAEQFKGLLDRQKAAVAESERLTEAAVKAKRWERPLLASLAGLADRQAGLAEELRSFAEKRLADLKVFDRMARQAADQMERAAARLRERKDDALIADPAAFDAEAEAAADEVARRPMRAALRRLEQIVAAVKPDADEKKPQPGGGPMGGGGGGGGGAGGAPNGDGVPPLAQLKAMREWQKDINERTATFAKDHPDPDKLTDDEKDELQELEKAQKDIAELFAQLQAMFQPMGEIIP